MRTTNEHCAHVATFYFSMWKRLGGHLDADGRARGSDAALAWFSKYWREAEHAAHPGCVA
jgi:hypothetical protein